MALEELKRRMASRVDVDGAWNDYAKTGGESLDGFLAYLRGKDLITPDELVELHGGGEISVARLVGVRKDKTLILEQPAQGRTWIAPGPGDATLVPGPGDATMIPQVVPADGSAPHAAPAGPRASQYELLGRLGKGAMGEVYLARDGELLRKVAFKKMVPEVAQSRPLAARFFSEIQVTAQLDHPHIVPIYGLEVTDGDALGYSMKLVQGRTLAAILDEHRARPARGEPARLSTRLEYFLKVCDAIAYAHSKGVLHRDLKPENIMVGRYNEVYVMDWGICRVIGNPDPTADEIEDAAHTTAATQRTQFGAVLGTPAYMSPEQAMGKNHELDGRSDQYALGLILFELVALRPAQHGESLEEVLARARDGVKDDLVHAFPGVRIPRELRAIVARATARAPDDRYPTVAALAEDVRRFLRGGAVEAQPDNLAQRAARFVGRHRAASLAALLGIVVLGAAATIAALVRGERAIEAAHLREERLQQLLLAAGTQAHAIDNQFYRYEGLLEGLAGRTLETLARTRAAPPDTRAYLDADFGDPARRPPDLEDSKFYGMPVSLDHVALNVAPGVTPDSVAGDARLLASLRPAFEAAVLGSAADNDSIELDHARDRLIGNGLPVLRAFVTLATGVHASYPGTGGFPDDYDGRRRPKYTLVAGKRGMVWGNAYVDTIHDRGVVLPISAPLLAADGELLGVAGFDASFEYLGKQLLELSRVPSVQHTFLVDERNRVVVGWSRQGGFRVPQPAPGAGRDEPLPLPAFEHRLDGDHGIHDDDESQVIVWKRLASLGWTYVAIADLAATSR